MRYSQVRSSNDERALSAIALKVQEPMRSFSLVEVLVVIAVLALLAAVLVPAAGRVRRSAKRSLCQSHLRCVGTALETYTSSQDYYPFGGSYDDVYKPCPENYLHDEMGKEHETFTCPEDKKLNYADAVRERGWWVASKFWPAESDRSKERYVRDMFRFDRRPVARMEGSYIWCEHILSTPTHRAHVWSPGTLGIVSEGWHVVNRWEWGSLNCDVDRRIDQKHVNDTINVLYADGHVKQIAAEGDVNDPNVQEISKVRCDPRGPNE